MHSKPLRRSGKEISAAAAGTANEAAATAAAAAASTAQEELSLKQQSVQISAQEQQLLAEIAACRDASAKLEQDQATLSSKKDESAQQKTQITSEQRQMLLRENRDLVTSFLDIYQHGFLGMGSWIGSKHAQVNPFRASVSLAAIDGHLRAAIKVVACACVHACTLAGAFLGV